MIVLRRSIDAPMHPTGAWKSIWRYSLALHNRPLRNCTHTKHAFMYSDIFLISEKTELPKDGNSMVLFSIGNKGAKTKPFYQQLISMA